MRRLLNMSRFDGTAGRPGTTKLNFIMVRNWPNEKYTQGFGGTPVSCTREINIQLWRRIRRNTPEK
jgi:hypothetical protein